MHRPNAQSLRTTFYAQLWSTGWEPRTRGNGAGSDFPAATTPREIGSQELAPAVILT